MQNLQSPATSAQFHGLPRGRVEGFHTFINSLYSIKVKSPSYHFTTEICLFWDPPRSTNKFLDVYIKLPYQCIQPHEPISLHLGTDTLLQMCSLGVAFLLCTFSELVPSAHHAEVEKRSLVPLQVYCISLKFQNETIQCSNALQSF